MSKLPFRTIEILTIVPKLMHNSDGIFLHVCYHLPNASFILHELDFGLSRSYHDSAAERLGKVWSKKSSPPSCILISDDKKFKILSADQSKCTIIDFKLYCLQSDSWNVPLPLWIIDKGWMTTVYFLCFCLTDSKHAARKHFCTRVSTKIKWILSFSAPELLW